MRRTNSYIMPFFILRTLSQLQEIKYRQNQLLCLEMESFCIKRGIDEKGFLSNRPVPRLRYPGILTGSHLLGTVQQLNTHIINFSYKSMKPFVINWLQTSNLPSVRYSTMDTPKLVNNMKNFLTKASYWSERFLGGVLRGVMLQGLTCRSREHV